MTWQSLVTTKYEQSLVTTKYETMFFLIMGEVKSQNRRKSYEVKVQVKRQQDNKTNRNKTNRQKDNKTKTSQELRMLSSVTINRQVTKIVMKPGSQLPVL